MVSHLSSNGCVLLFFVALPNVAALDNGAARTPPMGWSTWNSFRCNFNSTKLLEVSDAMVSSGMVAAGYSTLNIDDCWPLRSRDEQGSIVPNPAKFPFGMRNFSDELAERKLGLGIYTAHGNLTCKHFPGSLGHETQDAMLYASWNVVFVKNDWCWHDTKTTDEHLNAFNAMRDALNATGKAIVHSIHWNYGNLHGPGCAKGIDCPLPLTANMWRIGGDIGPRWSSILRLLDTDRGHASAVGPGSWNDADMLEVGNGMSYEQDKAHFTMWCILASPLIAGNDVRTMSKATRDILTNRHAIAVNQDKLGKQGQLVLNGTDGVQVWAKELSTPLGAYAVAFLNKVQTANNATFPFSLLGAHHSEEYEILDLWADAASLGKHRTSITVSIPPTATVFYRLLPQSSASYV